MSSPPAIIPAAGQGTRLRPITNYLSKPMLPVGSEPVIRYSIEEALRANCAPILVVVSPEHRSLIEYLGELQKDIPEIRWTEQPAPRGLGDALLVGYDDLPEPDSVAALIPDNVILSGSGMKPLLEVSSSHELVMGTMNVHQTEADYFGNSGHYNTVDEEPLSGEDHELIDRLQSKGNGTFGKSVEEWPARRTVPRYVLGFKFFELAREMDPDPESGELDEVPILRKMLNDSPALGVPVDGDVYDMGNPERYLRLCSRLFDSPKDLVDND